MRGKTVPQEPAAGKDKLLIPVILQVQPTVGGTERCALGMQQITRAMPLPTPVQKREIGACLRMMNFLNGLPASLKFQKIKEITGLGFVTTTVDTAHHIVKYTKFVSAVQPVAIVTHSLCGLLPLVVVVILIMQQILVVLVKIAPVLVTPFQSAVFWMEALQNSPPSPAGAGVPHLTLIATKSPTV